MDSIPAASHRDNGDHPFRLSALSQPHLAHAALVLHQRIDVTRQQGQSTRILQVHLIRLRLAIALSRQVR